MIRHWIGHPPIGERVVIDMPVLYRGRPGWTIEGPFVPESSFITEGAVEDATAMRVLLESIRAHAVRDDLDLRQTVAVIDRILRGQSGGADELDATIRAAADDPADGRTIEDILITAGQRMRGGEPLTVALAHAADPAPDSDAPKET